MSSSRALPQLPARSSHPREPQPVSPGIARNCSGPERSGRVYIGPNPDHDSSLPEPGIHPFIARLPPVGYTTRSSPAVPPASREEDKHGAQGARGPREAGTLPVLATHVAPNSSLSRPLHDSSTPQNLANIRSASGTSRDAYANLATSQRTPSLYPLDWGSCQNTASSKARTGGSKGLA